MPSKDSPSCLWKNWLLASRRDIVHRPTECLLLWAIWVSNNSIINYICLDWPISFPKEDTLHEDKQECIKGHGSWALSLQPQPSVRSSKDRGQRCCQKAGQQLWSFQSQSHQDNQSPKVRSSSLDCWSRWYKGKVPTFNRFLCIFVTLSAGSPLSARPKSDHKLEVEFFVSLIILLNMQGWQEDGVKVPYKLTFSVINCSAILTSENTFHLRGFFVDHLRTTMICRYTLLRYEDLVADFESTVSVLFSHLDILWTEETRSLCMFFLFSF